MPKQSNINVNHAGTAMKLGVNMRASRVMFQLLLLVNFSACSTFAQNNAARGLAASDDEVLATLASLAKRGAKAVCNVGVLERELGIKIGELTKRPIQSPALRLLETIEEEADTVTSLQPSVKLKSISFGRSSSKNGGGCRLDVAFVGDRFCERTGYRIEQIMGAQTTYTNLLHALGYGYSYHYQKTEHETIRIVLGGSREKCSNEFNLIAAGDWK